MSVPSGHPLVFASGVLPPADAARCVSQILKQDITLNLLLCAGSFDPAKGGPSMSVSQLGAELARDGVTVGLWAQDGSAITSTLVKREERLLPLAGNLKQIVRSFQPDIVHDNGIWLPQNHSLTRLATHYNLPRIVSIRGMLERWAFAHKRVKNKLAWLAYQKRDLNRAAAPLSREPACSRKLTGLWDGACYHPSDDLRGNLGRVDEPDRPLFAGRQMVVTSRRAHGTADGVSHRWAL